MNVWVNVLLTWYCIHVISYIKHIVCYELSDVKTISLNCLCVQQNIRTINSKDKSYQKKCVRVWITSVPPAIVTSYCFKLMTMIMMMITGPRLLVKPYVVSGPPLCCNKDVTHNTACLLRVSLLLFGLFSPPYLRSYRVAPGDIFITCKSTICRYSKHTFLLVTKFVIYFALALCAWHKP